MAHDFHLFYTLTKKEKSSRLFSFRIKNKTKKARRCFSATIMSRVKIIVKKPTHTQLNIVGKFPALLNPKSEGFDGSPH